MRHILLIRHHCLLANHTVALVTLMLGRHYIGLIAEETSPCPLLPWNPNGFVVVIMRDLSCRCNIIGLGCWPFPIIFDILLDRRSHQYLWVKEKYSSWLSNNKHLVECIYILEIKTLHEIAQRPKDWNWVLTFCLWFSYYWSMIIPWNPNGFVVVIMRDLSCRCNIIGLGCWPFPIIFDILLDRRSHQYLWVKEKYSSWLSNNKHLVECIYILEIKTLHEIAQRPKDWNWVLTFCLWFSYYWSMINIP